MITLSKGGWHRSRDILFKFWEPPYISGTAENINIKFCMQIAEIELHLHPETWSNGAWPRSRDLLFKFWDPRNMS